MAEIFPFPTDAVATAGAGEVEPFDAFLLEEGLEFLADFRSIEDRAVRSSLRVLVKSLAGAPRKPSDLDKPGL